MSYWQCGQNTADIVTSHKPQQQQVWGDPPNAIQRRDALDSDDSIHFTNKLCACVSLGLSVKRIAMSDLWQLIRQRRWKAESVCGICPKKW